LKLLDPSPQSFALTTFGDRPQLFSFIRAVIPPLPPSKTFSVPMRSIRSLSPPWSGVRLSPRCSIWRALESRWPNVAATEFPWFFFLTPASLMPKSLFRRFFSLKSSMCLLTRTFSFRFLFQSPWTLDRLPPSLDVIVRCVGEILPRLSLFGFT